MKLKLPSWKSLYTPNLVINGDFQIWQRGEEITVSNGEFPCDMWRVYCGEWADGVKFKKVDNGLEVVDFISPKVDTPQCNIYQYQKYQPYLTGKKWIKQKSINGKIQIETGTFGGEESGKSFIGNANGLKKGDIVSFVRVDIGEIAYTHKKEDTAIALIRCQKYISSISGILNGFTDTTGKFITLQCDKIMDMEGSPVLVGGLGLILRIEGNESKPGATEATVKKETGEIVLTLGSSYSSIASRTISGRFESKIIVTSEPL